MTGEGGSYSDLKSDGNVVEGVKGSFLKMETRQGNT